MFIMYPFRSNHKEARLTSSNWPGFGLVISLGNLNNLGIPGHNKLYTKPTSKHTLSRKYKYKIKQDLVNIT